MPITQAQLAQLQREQDVMDIYNQKLGVFHQSQPIRAMMTPPPEEEKPNLLELALRVLKRRPLLASPQPGNYRRWYELLKG